MLERLSQVLYCLVMLLGATILVLICLGAPPDLTSFLGLAGLVLSGMAMGVNQHNRDNKPEGWCPICQQVGHRPKKRWF